MSKHTLHLSRKSIERSRVNGYVPDDRPSHTLASKSESTGKFAPHIPEPGEALPRTHNTLKDPAVYEPTPMVSSRPHADDFLQIKSRGF